MKIIYDLEEARNYKRGWTYVLLSKDKRMMKIGHAKTDLKRRVYQNQHIKQNKQYDFQFLLAIDHAKYEHVLHKHFGKYQCCYKWLEGEHKGQHFNEREANTLALRLFKKDKVNYSSTYEAFNDNTQVTRLELFSIPPRKIGARLTELITEAVTEITK
jgi:hypothetical protein